LAIVVALIWKVGDHPTLWSSIGIALSGGTALNTAAVSGLHRLETDPVDVS
jgi:hypothetical protein